MTWIRCTNDSPPPTQTPMLLWMPKQQRGAVTYHAWATWCEDWQDVGESGTDFTHYMIMTPPSEDE